MKLANAIKISIFVALGLLAGFSKEIDPKPETEHFSPPCHEDGWRKAEKGRECVRWGWSRK